MFFTSFVFVNIQKVEKMKKDSTALRRYLDGFPVRESSELLTRITVGCKVSRTVAFNWKYGACRIPELAKDKIEEILGEKIFDRMDCDGCNAEGPCDD